MNKKIIAPILFSIVALAILIIPFVNADVVTTTQPFILNFSTGQSFTYQDMSNSALVTVLVTSGSLTGTGTLSSDGTTGTLDITPSSTCTVTLSLTNAFTLVNAVYLTTYAYSYSSGVEKSISWIFTLPSPTPTPSPPAPPFIAYYYLAVQSSGQGTTIPITGYYAYSPNTQVPLYALPASGWAFNYWLLSNGTQVYVPILTLTMTSNETALAVFQQIPIPGQPTPTPTVPPTPIPTTYPFHNGINTGSLWQYLNNLDFAGFIIACWTMNLGQSFFVILALIVSIAIYVRYQNLIVIGAMWIVLGSIFIVWIPIVAPFIIFAFVMGIGSLLFKVLGEPKL